MPKRRSSKMRKRAHAAIGKDRISNLPDVILHDVLSYLPSHEAVRSCVLSRRWRHLWKSVHVLHITHANSWDSPAGFNKFVNRLLLSRASSPLDEFEFQTYTYMPLMASSRFADSVEPVRYVEQWTAHAIDHNVQVLRVLVDSRNIPLLLVNVPLTSQHLTTLELQCVQLDNRGLDFSSCYALEDLKMTYCKITGHKLSSQSLKRLCITSCNFDHRNFRTQISAPGLVSLKLSGSDGRAPLLESMPLLETACLRLESTCPDSDNSRYVYCGDCHAATCLDCYGTRDGSDKSVLLRALPSAMNLKLGAGPGVRIFKLDLAWCPTFSKLKTLLLDGWVVRCDFRALVCFLQHAPILEKLTLQLYMDDERMMNMEESCSPVQQLLQSEHLKIFEVRCREVDKRIHNFLKTLITYGLSPDKIGIRITKSKFSDISFEMNWEDLATDESTSS